MPSATHGRGILCPSRLLTFERVVAPVELANLISLVLV